MSKKIQITNGPSREELFNGLRLFAEKRLVEFQIENNGRQMKPKVWIHSIEAEDGSGQSWNLKFSIEKSFISKMPYPIKLNKPTVPEHCTVVAYFSTKTRNGVISIED